MKRYLISFKVILFLSITLTIIPYISSLRINEVEGNPAEGVSGKEWVELYNEGEDLDISSWSVYDGLSKPAKRYTIPNGTLIKSREYFIVEFNSARILNNDGDFVTIYDSSGNKIDETETLKETTSSSNTWQFCGKWEFKEQTKGKENECKKEEKEDEVIVKNETEEENLSEKNQNETVEEGEIKEESSLDNLSAKNEEAKKKELAPIKLNTKALKSRDNSEGSNKNTYVLYGFGVFCILLVFLFILRKRKIIELQ